MAEIERREPVAVRLPAHGLAVVASRHGADFHMPSDRQPYHKLLLVREGAGGLLFDQEGLRVDLVPGALALVPAGIAHHIDDDPDRPLVLEIACIDPAALAARPLCQATLDPFLTVGGGIAGCDGYHRSRLQRLLGDLRFELTEDRVGSELAAWGRFDQVVALLARIADQGSDTSGTSDDDGLDAVMAWLDQHFIEAVGLAALAARADLPERTFSARFRRRCGCSLGTWLARRRCEHAARLLMAGHAVIDAALASGYGDLGHFYRQFRRHFGAPPARWAKDQS